MRTARITKFGLAGVAAILIAFLAGALIVPEIGDAVDPDEAARRSAVQGSLDLPRSTFQDGLLEDGLTQPEYDEAFTRYSACIVQAGGRFVPEPPSRNERGTWNFVVGTDPLIGADGQTGVDRVAVEGVKACGFEYFGAVQSRWTAEHMPTKAETEAALAGIAPCMEARGIEMPDNLPAGWGLAYQGKPAPEGLRTDRDAGLAFAACSQEAAQTLGMAPGDGILP